MSRLGSAARDERGVALPAVLGVMLVVLLTASLVVASSVSSAGFATSSRAQVQATANANSGIEAVRLQLMLGVPVCRVVDASAGYDATVSYADASGDALSCDTSVATPPHRAVGTPATATIVSTGRATVHGAAGNSSEDSVKTAATVLLQSNANTNPLTQSVFSESALTLPNNTQLQQSNNGAFDGDVYSNGSVTCGTQDQIFGTLYAIGGLTGQNNCTTYGDVWVSGNVDFSSTSVVVKGSIYATGSVNVGTGTVGGNIIANDSVTMGTPSSGVITCTNGESDGTVCGSIYSLNGAITATTANGTKVYGSEYARGNITSGGGSNALIGGDAISLTGNVSPGSGSKVGGKVMAGKTASTAGVTVGGTTCGSGCGTTLTLPLPVNANPPFAVQLPMFDHDSSVGSLGDNVTTNGLLVKVVPPARQSFPQITENSTTWTTGTGWSFYDHTAPIINIPCGADGTSAVNALSSFENANKNQKVLVRFLGCSGPVSLSVNSGTLLKLTGDLAIMSDSGINANGIQVQSADGVKHQFMLIVPAESPGVTWKPAPAGSPAGQVMPSCPSSGQPGISISNQPQFSAPVSLFAYTPCTLTVGPMANGGAVTAQLYGGTMSFSGDGVKLIRGQSSVPGVSVPGSTTTPTSFTVTVTSRFAVNGR